MTKIDGEAAIYAARIIEALKGLSYGSASYGTNYVARIEIAHEGEPVINITANDFEGFDIEAAQ